MKTLLITLLFLLPNISFASIAHYASYDVSNVFTGSFDGGSGSNRTIILHGAGDTSDNISSVTWNGENFTKMGTTLFPATTRYNVIWCLQPTGSGTQNYAINGIGGSSVMTMSVYTGAGACKNYVHTTGSGLSGSVTASPTPASDSWLVGGGGNDANFLIAGSNTTLRSGASSQGGADSNGVSSPTALNFTFNGSSANWSAYLIELPVATAVQVIKERSYNLINNARKIINNGRHVIFTF